MTQDGEARKGPRAHSTPQKSNDRNGPENKKRRKVTKGNLISILAAQTAASVNVVDMKVREIDAEIEEELQYESRKLHGSIARFRHRVEHLTHHKAALFTTVALNLCDAVLVVLELAFDFLFFSGGLDHPNEGTYGNKTCYYQDGHYKHYAHLSHYCHYASIGVLSVLLLFVLAHVFASGKRFFKYKINTLDFVVIIVAWSIDVVTQKGIHHYDHSKAIIFLMALLLLRIIRVLNSFIVIVMDGMRFQLRMMFTQKKRISQELEDSESRNQRLYANLKRIREFCISKGLDCDTFDRIVGDDNNNAPKGKVGNIVTRGLANSGAKVISGAKMVSDAAKKLAKRPQSGVNLGFREEGETTFTFVPEPDESGVFDQVNNRGANDEFVCETSIENDSREK